MEFSKVGDVLNCVQKKVVLWLCSKEFVKVRSNILLPPALSTAEQFMGVNPFYSCSESLTCMILVYVPLFCFFGGNLQIVVVEQLVLLALDF